MKEVLKPSLIRVGIHGSEKLYSLEHKRNKLVELCAKEWLRRFGLDPIKELYSRGIPQTLFDLLEGYGPSVAEAAAIGYLEYRGYAVTRTAATKGLHQG